MNKKLIETKKRKTPSGPLREKERTKLKMLASVGRVLKKKGYSGLNIATIAADCKVDRKLIYTYFGTLDNLIETYIVQQDYWKTKAKPQIEELILQNEVSKEEMISLLNGQFNVVYNDQTLQKILQWELSESHPQLRKLADSREEIGELLIERFIKSYSNKEIDLRAILAIQTAGLYYLALHARTNGSTFCGIDLNQNDGRQRIEKAINTIFKDLIKE